MTQPQALRLAEQLETLHIGGLGQVRAASAAELRRLHALNAELVEALNVLVVFLPSDHPEMPDTQRIGPGFVSIRWMDLRQARAALSKAKEQ